MGIIYNSAWLPFFPHGNKWLLPTATPIWKNDASCGKHSQYYRKWGVGVGYKPWIAWLQWDSTPTSFQWIFWPLSKEVRGQAHCFSGVIEAMPWWGTLSAPQPRASAIWCGVLSCSSWVCWWKMNIQLCLQVSLGGKKEAFTLLLAQVSGPSVVTWVPALQPSVASRMEPHSWQCFPDPNK